MPAARAAAETLRDPTFRTDDRLHSWERPATSWFRAENRPLRPVHRSQPAITCDAHGTPGSARLGAFIEFVGGSLNDADAAARMTRFADAIRAIGPEHCIVSSDLGATFNTTRPHLATNARIWSHGEGEFARIDQESRAARSRGSVLFAVMEIADGTGPVYPALRSLHTNQTIFSYGISDSPGGIYLYKPSSKNGVLVTGKPTSTQLPPPFNQVPGVGIGHQIHHKFVVCGFNGPDPVVYCGSSNLAQGGEEDNGDNLLAIRDGDIATVFALEALARVDHFHFLDSVAKAPDGAGRPTTAPPPAVKVQAAVRAGLFLSTTDGWTKPYYDPEDLRSVDRVLFA